VSGYTFEGFSGDCDSNGATTVALGESKTCTLTNNDEQAYITVVKNVINNSGGSAEPDDFDLMLDSISATSGVAIAVDPGTYTATETLVSGYTFEGFSGDCDSNGATTVALGESKTCTLTNDDQYATKSGYKRDADSGIGLAGWVIELWDISDVTPTRVASDTTNFEGYYEFDAVVAGKTYAVCEVASILYFQTFPNGSTPDPAGEQIYECSTVLGAEYSPYGYQFTPEAGAEYPNNDFENREAQGCTYTQGYWKTHSSHGPAGPADPGWYTPYGPYPPGGPNGPLFNSGLTWYQAFNTAPKGGNAWFILAHQWMAAYLNLYNGAGSGGTSVVAWITDGAVLLIQYDDDGAGDPLIPKDSPDREDAIELAAWLDDYNNGYIGPGSCDAP
jgi:hypothetical protein